MRAKTFLLCAVVAAVSLLVGAAFQGMMPLFTHANGDSAAPPRPLRPAAPPLNLSDEELRDAVEAYRLYMFSRDLDLTPDQLGAALPLWGKLIETRSEFWRDRRMRLQELRGTVDSAPDSEALGEAAQTFRRADEIFWEKFRADEGRLMNLLTPRQQALYILADAEHPRRAARIYRALRSVDGSNETRDAILSDRR